MGRLLAVSYPKLMAGAYDRALLRLALPTITQPNSRLLASGSYFVVHVPGFDPLAACGGWTFDAPGSGVVKSGVAHIRHFATHPDWIGRGIGRAIYNRCEADARAAGAQEFECYSSLNAQRFYEVLGFTPIRMVDVPMASGIVFPSVLMRCAI